MAPAISFPRENQAIPRPEDLAGCNDGVEHAAGAWGGMKHLACGAGLDVYYANRPRLTFPLRAKLKSAGGCRDSQKRDLFSVGRPNRRGIAIDAGVQVFNRLGGDVVQTDQPVIF